MLSVALLVALVLSSGTAVSAHAALSVSLSGAASFTGVDNAVVSAKVTNTGDETLKVLNAPGSVLSKGPTDVFSISSGGGKAPHFRGLFAKYNPSHAKSYTTLAPGQSVVVEHSLAAAYDFTASGAGTYRITSSPEFFIVANGGVKRLSADVSAHTARLSGNLKSKLALENLQVAITAPTCNSTARSELRAAAQGADTLVAQAVAYLNAHSAGTATSRYTTWFGAATIARYAHVQLAFDSLSATSFATDVTYECVTGAVCNPDFVDSDAFTRTDTPGHIWICPAYFEPNDEGETPSGLLVHLGTHWDTVAHTGHWAFGIEASEELASALPDFAIDNADSYEYFAQNTHMNEPAAVQEAMAPSDSHLAVQRSLTRARNSLYPRTARYPMDFSFGAACLRAADPTETACMLGGGSTSQKRPARGRRTEQARAREAEAAAAWRCHSGADVTRCGWQGRRQQGGQRLARKCLRARRKRRRKRTSEA